MCADTIQSDHGPIPHEWRATVVRILNGDPQHILTTRESERDWNTLFPASFAYERHAAMAAALRVDGVEGRRIHGMTPEGETYAFFFHHEDRKLYGKINLLVGNRVILIISSHLPDPKKGNRL